MMVVVEVECVGVFFWVIGLVFFLEMDYDFCFVVD